MFFRIPRHCLLIKLMNKQKQQAFHPGTRSNHMTQFATYVSFFQQYGFQVTDPTKKTICLHTAYLTQHFSSPKSVANYVSGTKLMHKVLTIPPPALQSFELTMALCAISITMCHVTNLHPLCNWACSESCVSCVTQ